MNPMVTFQLPAGWTAVSAADTLLRGETVTARATANVTECRWVLRFRVNAQASSAPEHQHLRGFLWERSARSFPFSERLLALAGADAVHDQGHNQMNQDSGCLERPSGWKPRAMPFRPSSFDATRHIPGADTAF
jgi:hypothetical protein